MIEAIDFIFATIVVLSHDRTGDTHTTAYESH